ncbi:ammonium transporter [Leptospira sp. 201903074]|uniref:ammonium transporter n=1 Tax=Leptospira abararensis TaxID=2810036 RepID=UPI001962EF8A|nr:ammonium transporter [Leptospira abararensis]MBM9547244.1 ammonium transporter [Leptospira abararensis]
MKRFGIFLSLSVLLIGSALGAEEVANETQSLETLAKEMAGIKTSLAETKLALETTKQEANWVWTCIAAFLVFFMQAGFAYVEAGFTRAKNAVNILMKNFSDLTVGAIAYWLVGFSIMFGPQVLTGFGVGVPAFAETLINTEDGNMDPSKYTFFIFQIVFAATAATIVSGAMAERTKFSAYLVFSIVITAFIYPIFGSFAWGSLLGISTGFLESLGLGGGEGVGFHDFAGSTVVHSVGAWAGLAGALVVGPRMGKFQTDGRVYPILGHNMSMAALGVFILWFGWFGFNPGSTTSIEGGSFARIAVVTHMAACAGAIAAMVLTWLLFKKPEIGLTLNGGLAGLVAITAPCDVVSITGAVCIGAVAGILVIVSVLFLDKIKIDDPVGAVSVHGVCGAWGTLAVGLFSLDTGLFYGSGFAQFAAQAIGVVTAFLWAFPTSFAVFYLIKKTIGLRVSEEEELLGLDILEHGNEAYPVSK